MLEERNINIYIAALCCLNLITKLILKTLLPFEIVDSFRFQSNHFFFLGQTRPFHYLIKKFLSQQCEDFQNVIISLYSMLYMYDIVLFGQIVSMEIIYYDLNYMHPMELGMLL